MTLLKHYWNILEPSVMKRDELSLPPQSLHQPALDVLRLCRFLQDQQNALDGGEE